MWALLILCFIKALAIVMMVILSGLIVHHLGMFVQKSLIWAFHHYNDGTPEADTMETETGDHLALASICTGLLVAIIITFILL